jgi:hypothetical protein
MKVFPGGSLIQENFLFKPMKGGWYRKGGTFNTTRPTTKAAMQFEMKKAYVNVTEYLEDIEIELRTPHAVFDTVKVDLANAALTLSAILEIAMFHHGQAYVGDDRLPAFNGLEEALTDGTNQTWSGKTFTSYGGQARADVDGALTSPTGLISSPSVAAISNHVLEHSYLSCVIGEEEPRLGITTNRCMGFINEHYSGMQRLADTREPVIGWSGVKFRNATIIQSQYCPGQDGENDPDLGNYLASGGETFWWLNPGGEADDAFFRLWLSASKKFQFGWTGFKGDREDTMVSGQILFAGNFVVRAPRLMRALYGITK